MSSLLIILYAFCNLSFSNSLFQIVLANNQTENTQVKNTDFLFYNNKQYMFQLIYPKNWSVIEFDPFYSELNKNIIVSFVSPLENFQDSFSEYLSVKIIKDDRIKSNKNWKDFIFVYKKYLNEMLSNFNSHNIYDNNSKNYLFLNNSYVKNNDPYVIIYDFVSPPTINKKMEVLLFHDDNIFIFEYGSIRGDFDKYLGIIDKMISSFKI